MEIEIENRTQKELVDLEAMKKTMAKILSDLECPGAAVAISLVDDEEIADVHEQFMNIPGATNVISFAFEEGEVIALPPGMSRQLGDVMISLDTAERDAAEADWNSDDEVLYLAIHGVLHLLGYDHEGERATDAPEMEAKERELFNRYRGSIALPSAGAQP